MNPGQGATSFEANGKTYRKASSIAFARFPWLRKLQVDFSYGHSAEELFNGDKKAFELLNAGKNAEAAVALHYNMQGYADIANERHSIASQLMALFWNHDNEDTRYMSDELMAEKMADWEMAGLDLQFVFQQALSAVPALLNAFKQNSGGSSSASTEEYRGVPEWEYGPDTDMNALRK